METGLLNRDVYYQQLKSQSFLRLPHFSGKSKALQLAERVMSVNKLQIFQELFRRKCRRCDTLNNFHSSPRWLSIPFHYSAMTMAIEVTQLPIISDLFSRFLSPSHLAASTIYPWNFLCLMLDPVEPVSFFHFFWASSSISATNSKIPTLKAKAFHVLLVYVMYFSYSLITSR